MLAIYILNSNIKDVFSYISKLYLNENFILNPKINAESIRKESVSLKSYNNFYNGKNNNFKKTYQQIIDNLIKEKQFFLYNNIELPFTFILIDIEFFGIKIDLKELDIQYNNLENELKLLVKKINLELENWI